MKKINNYVNLDGKTKASLKATFHKAEKNQDFNIFIKAIDLPKEQLMKYTSILEKCCAETKHCRDCPGLVACSNEINGHVYTPEVMDSKLIFEYVPCKYELKRIKASSYQKNVLAFEMPDEIINASMKEIDLKDSKRAKLIKWLDKFVTNYQKGTKGLYLSGSFGSGKTYLISAALNELAKIDIKVAVIYWPEFLRKLKNSFNTDSNLFEEVKTKEILLIDDIGAETTTPWSRDEILSSLLQYRMEQKLTTFFTSNLSLEELELHLANTKDQVNVVKARRIIERIQQLTSNLELISVNRRK